MNLKLKNDPMMNIKNYIKKTLGITSLENEITRIQRENEQIKYRLFDLHSRTEEVFEDNRVVLRHIKFINSQFSVVSDIQTSMYEPSVVLIFHRGPKEIVKTYTFNNNTVEEIYRMLEGFGKEVNRIDKPRSFPNPRWRY